MKRNRVSSGLLALIVIGLLVVSSVGLWTSTVAEGEASATGLVVDGSGAQIEEIIISGKPPETKAMSVDIPAADTDAGINVLSDVPAFDWSYGCSATSAAMLFGYYDRNGYGNMYYGATNGGVCPLENSMWGDTVYPGVTCHECPLSATHQGVDGRTSRGHVDDYWIDYGNAGPDPYIVNGWTEHVQGDCTGDFMGTNQSKFASKKDGATSFYYYPDGSPLYDYTACEPGNRDGGHGLRLFAESRGYAVETNFNQRIKGQGSNPELGFTFEQFTAEIDAGRPVLIHVTGHTMLGYGYNTTGNLVYIRDTWDHSSHQMTWGGTYSSMQHYGVTVIRLAASTYGVSWGSHDTPTAMDAGQTCAVSISLTNTSNFTWPSGGANPVHLAYHWYTPGGELVEWDGQRSALSADLPPGGSATVSATVNAPSAPGSYVLKWDLVQEGVTWFGLSGCSTLDVEVNIAAEYGVTWNGSDTPSTMDAGQACAVSVSLTNTSNFTWLASGANPVHLSYHWYTLDGYMVEWDGQRSVLSADVAPGESAMVSATVTAPGAPGSYILKWDLVQEGVTWFSLAGCSTLDVEVDIAAQYGVTWNADDTPTAMEVGRTYVVSIAITNTSNFTWPSDGANPVHLSYHWYTSDGNLVEWDGQRSQLPADVAAGESTTVSATVTAPGAAGSYILKWDLVQEGVTWFSLAGCSTLDVGVDIAAQYGVTWNSHDTPSAMDAGQTYVVSITITNTSNFTWPAGGPNPVHLAYHWYTPDGHLVQWDGQRSMLSTDLAPGESKTVSATMTAPGAAGSYVLQWDLVQEGVTWFGLAGCSTLDVGVMVG